MTEVRHLSYPSWICIATVDDPTLVGVRTAAAIYTPRARGRVFTRSSSHNGFAPI
ncbi:hypothetical protein SK128_021153, partial [Halocaridina rubra]